MNNKTLPVEQVDRDAAADFYGPHLSRPGEVLVTAHMRAGKIDESPLVQAFAKHRIQVAERESAPNRLAARMDAVFVPQVAFNPAVKQSLTTEVAEAVREACAKMADRCDLIGDGYFDDTGTVERNNRIASAIRNLDLSTIGERENG